jgi:putative endonuclease
MHYVYLLYSTKLKKHYVGETKDLKRRFPEHNDGSNISTKPGRPWKLIYYEAYSSVKAARIREKRLKYYGKGFAQLKRRVWADDE